MPTLLRHRKLLIGAGIFALLLVLAFWPKAAGVDLARATRGPLVVTVEEEGETRVRERFVVSAPVAARVLRIELEPGDPVKRGRTVVATLQPADPDMLDARRHAETAAAARSAEAGLGRARAEREQARVTARLARSELERLRALAEQKIVSAETLETAEAQTRGTAEALRAADYLVASADHELAMARARLMTASRASGAAGDPLAIRSPIDGVVLKRLRESEAVVPAGEPLLELGDPRQLEIVADFLSSDAVRIHAGDEVRIERWGGGRVLRGRVRRVEPAGFMKVSALGVEEQRVNVLIDIAEPFDLWQRLGDAFRVEVGVIVWQAQDALRVPTSSLFRRGERWAVFAHVGRRARLREVQIGERNGLEAQVLGGLAAGERVVLHPSDALRDGSRIKGNP